MKTNAKLAVVRLLSRAARWSAPTKAAKGLAALPAAALLAFSLSAAPQQQCEMRVAGYSGTTT